jgi:hypothetical protein
MAGDAAGDLIADVRLLLIDASSRLVELDELLDTIRHAAAGAHIE